MSRVFVSHASADADLIDEFVNILLRNGCNLHPDEIFYTSGEDTGIPSGEDLIATVRAQVSEATLVIALVTPTYQTRPVCVAELGAAWGRSNLLLPLMLPDMPRTDLEGVLAGMTIRTLGDSAALDEVHDRVRVAAQRNVKAATWNRHKQRWLKALPELIEMVPTPDTVSATDLEQLQQDLVGAQEALGELEKENAQLKLDLTTVSKLKNASEVAEARLPVEEQARFDALVAKTSSALKPLHSVVVDALWADRFSSGLPRPDWNDRYRAEDVDEAVNDGFLYEGDDGMLYADRAAGAVDRAVEQVDRLQTFLTEECSEEFFAWFKALYDFDPDLRKKQVWKQLF